MEDIRRFERENTVSSEHQVNNRLVRSDSDARPRILFVGNSITLHGVNDSIGWHWNWGMAASAKEKDYVHQTMRMVREIAPEATFMQAQCADWERNFWLDDEYLRPVSEAADWAADIVVIRIGENIREPHMKEHDLLPHFEKMIDCFTCGGQAKLIVTSLFWPNPDKDDVILKAAQSRNAAYVDIRDLGTKDEMKAIGLFEHAGVAAHPGDLGMLKIAEAIFGAMKPMLKGE